MGLILTDFERALESGVPDESPVIAVLVFGVSLAVLFRLVFVVFFFVDFVPVDFASVDVLAPVVGASAAIVLAERPRLSTVAPSTNPTFFMTPPTNVRCWDTSI